jgi:hypothetical protein
MEEAVMIVQGQRFDQIIIQTWRLPSFAWPHGRIKIFIFNSYSEKPIKMQQRTKILLFLILNKVQHVSGNTPPIIRSLKLHKQL